MNAFLNEMRALAVSLYPFNGIPSGYEAQKLEIFINTMMVSLLPYLLMPIIQIQ